VNTAANGFYHREDAMDGAVPTWTSAKPSGTDMVVIPPSDPNYLHVTGSYLITAYGYTAAEFIVRVVGGNAASNLQDGIQATGSLKAGQYQYFRYYDNLPSEDIWFDLMPSGGDADIYVSCQFTATNTDEGYPSKAMGHYNFSSILYLEDTLVIPATADSKSSCHRRGAASAVYYVAVYAMADCTFKISAIHSSGTRHLVAGIPYLGLIYKRMEMKFDLHIGYEIASLIVQLLSLSGDCDLFVKLNGVAGFGDADYYSIKAGSAMDVVYIPEEDICANCWIGVTVYGYMTSQFSLLAYFSDTTITLTDGLPLRGSVSMGNIQYYALHSTQNATVVVTLTVFSGETPSLYMSKINEQPTNQNNSASRRFDSTWGSVPLVSLSNVRAGETVYIGVEGTVDNCSFTVRANTINTDFNSLPPLLYLQEGVPQVKFICSSSILVIL
jgi:hypothetical protein